MSLSVCAEERYDIPENRSCLIWRVQSHAMAEAILFAIMLNETAIIEHTTITAPQKIMRRVFSVPTTLLRRWASM